MILGRNFKYSDNIFIQESSTLLGMFLFLVLVTLVLAKLKFT